MTKPTRFKVSSAYIDSGLVTAFLVGVVSFSVWIGYETRAVIPMWWLSPSIIAVVVYQMLIFWLLLQYWEADRVLFIYTSNIVCLGLILGLVSHFWDVTLPLSLPILNLSASMMQVYGLESFDPGAVALSYGAIGLGCGLLLLLSYGFIDRLAFIKNASTSLGLDKIDLRIDVLLDHLSTWIAHGSYGWIVIPQVLLVITVTVVVGLAALI